MNLRVQAWRQCHGYGTSLGSSPLTTPLLLTSNSCSLARAATPWRRLHDKPRLFGTSQARHESNPPNPLVNPPASTRPPPLTVPARHEVDSRFRYFFELGKGYIRFFKDGVKAVWTNRKLLNQKLARTPVDDRPSILRPSFVPRSFSRADWVLLWRVRHDLLRLPLFGLMLLVLGEFTALVVFYVDGIVPYTCRIPYKVQSGLERAELRRRRAFDELDSRFPHGVLSMGLTLHAAQSHILRSLDIAGSIWDWVGFLPPGMWQIKGQLRMDFLAGDDMNLVQDGGVIGLVPEELRIACSERGIDVLGKSPTELRRWLGDWLRLTASNDMQDRHRRMMTLMLTRS